MKAKKVMRDEHGPRHVTPASRSVIYDLFPKAEADELVKAIERGITWQVAEVRVDLCASFSDQEPDA